MVGAAAENHTPRSTRMYRYVRSTGRLWFSARSLTPPYADLRPKHR